MKTRQGFVSNSSSSSFCIVGFSVDPRNDEEDFEILKQVGKFPEDAQFVLDGSWQEYDKQGIEMWVSYGLEELDNGLTIVGGSEGPSIVGLDAEGYLNQDWTISQIKQELMKKLTELGINIDSKTLFFECGEASSD